MPKVAYVMKLKPECKDSYVEIHRKDNVWDGIIDVNRRAGVSKEQIFVFEDYVFLYAEAEDLDNMQRVYSEDETLKKWDNITLRMMVPKSDDPMDVVTQIRHIYDYEDGELAATDEELE